MKLRIRILLAVGALALLLTPGVSASPSLQTQDETELAARLDRLEALVNQQNEQIETLMTRIAELECTVDPAMCAIVDDTIPDDWLASTSSDTTLRYRYSSKWELADDEPGTLTFHLHNEFQIILLQWYRHTMNVQEILDDEAERETLEQEIIGYLSSDTGTAEIVSFNRLTIADRPAAVWEAVMEENEERFDGRALVMYYSCGESRICELTLIQIGSNRQFAPQDWQTIRSLASSLEFDIGTATVNRNANLRQCPDVNCDIVGRALRGQSVEIVGQDRDGDWYLLADGEWIASWLVDDAPEELPILDDAANL